MSTSPPVVVAAGLFVVPVVLTAPVVPALAPVVPVLVDVVPILPVVVLTTPPVVTMLSAAQTVAVLGEPACVQR